MAANRLKLTLTRHQIRILMEEGDQLAQRAGRDQPTWASIAREAKKALDWDESRQPGTAHLSVRKVNGGSET